MRQKINQYRKEGRLALKHMWYVIMVFALVQIIVSIAVAASNDVYPNGYKSAAFAAIWSMFLVVIFAGLGAQIVFGGRAQELQVGFLIGVAAMLTELFFVLMVLFFILGNNAQTAGYQTYQADVSYGVFSLINMIIYFVWTIILVVHRKTVMISRQELEANQAKEFSAYDGSGGEVYNPTIGAAGGEEFGGEQEQL